MYAAADLTKTIEAFAGEQWRYYHDLMAELGKFCGPALGKMAVEGKGPELIERKTTLTATSWYLSDRASELWNRGKELAEALRQVEDGRA